MAISQTAVDLILPASEDTLIFTSNLYNCDKIKPLLFSHWIRNIVLWQP